DVGEQDRLNQERAHRAAIRRRVSERDRVLYQNPTQDPRDAFVDRPKPGTGLPRTLPRGFVGRRWKNEYRTNGHDQAALPARPRQHREVEELHVAELGTCSPAPAGRYRYQ